MSSSAEHAFSTEQLLSPDTEVKVHTVYQAICNVTLKTGEVLCMVDDAVSPPQVKPLSLETDKAFPEARDVMEQLVFAQLPQEAWLNKKNVFIYRENKMYLDSVPGQQTTVKAVQARIYDIRLDDTLEADVRRLATLSQSKLLLMPRGIIRQFSQQVLPPSVANFVWRAHPWSPKDVSDDARREIARNTVRVDAHNRVVIADAAPAVKQTLKQGKELHPARTVAENYGIPLAVGEIPSDADMLSQADEAEGVTRYKMSDGLKVVIDVEAQIPDELFLPESRKKYYLSAAKRFAVQIEKLLQKLNKDSNRHQLLFSDIKALSLVVDDEELITQLEEDLIVHRLVNFLVHNWSAALLEGLVTYGNLTGGAAGDNLSILAVLGHIGIDIDQEIRNGAIKGNIQKTLEKVLLKLAKDYEYEIKNGLIPDVGNLEWVGLPEHVAEAEMYPPGQVTPILLTQSAAFAANGHVEYAAVYAGLVVVVKSLERMTKSVIKLGEYTRLAIQVVLKNVPELMFTVLEKKLPNNNLLGWAGLLVPLLNYTLGRLLPHFQGKHVIDQSRADLVALRKVITILQERTLALPKRQQFEKDAFAKMVYSEYYPPTTLQLPVEPSLLEEERIKQEQVQLAPQRNYYDFRQAVSNDHLNQLDNERAVATEQVISRLYQQILPLMDDAEKYQTVIDLCLDKAVTELIKKERDDSTEGSNSQTIQLENQIITMIGRLNDPENRQGALLELLQSQPLARLMAIEDEMQALQVAPTPVQKTQSKWWQYWQNSRAVHFITALKEELGTKKLERKAKPTFFKRYQIMDDVYGKKRSSAPAVLAMDYDVAISDYVLFENISFYTDPEKITFLEGAKTVAFKIFAERLVHKKGNQIIQLADQDKSVQRDQARDELAFFEISDKEERTEQYYQQYPSTQVQAPDREQLLKLLSAYKKGGIPAPTELDQLLEASYIEDSGRRYQRNTITQLFIYLVQTELFTAEELEKYALARMRGASLVGGNAGLRTRLLLSESCLSSAHVLYLHKLFENRLTPDETNSICQFLEKLAQKKAIICSLPTGGSLAKDILELRNKCKTYRAENKKLMPAQPTVWQLIYILRQYGVPYAREAIDATNKLAYQPAADTITTADWNAIRDKQLMLAERPAQDLLKEVMSRQTLLHSWTVAELLEQIQLQGIQSELELDQLDPDKKVLVRDTEVTRVQITYQPADGGEKLYLVEQEQKINRGEGQQVNRFRHDVVGISKRFSTRSASPTTADEAAHRGLRQELAITSSPDRVKALGNTSYLKWSDTYQLPTIIRLSIFDYELTPEEFNQMGTTVTDVTSGRTTVYGFIRESQLERYLAGEKVWQQS